MNMKHGFLLLSFAFATLLHGHLAGAEEATASTASGESVGADGFDCGNDPNCPYQRDDEKSFRSAASITPSAKNAISQSAADGNGNSVNCCATQAVGTSRGTTLEEPGTSTPTQSGDASATD
ncbi:MAG: hypothetical protein NDI61_09625 [Bdellovibrionaceae bacterium]|nr:hypothetical protein [Pseudobdellovibrionaceae bacterium]